MASRRTCPAREWASECSPGIATLFVAEVLLAWLGNPHKDAALQARQAA